VVSRGRKVPNVIVDKKGESDDDEEDNFINKDDDLLLQTESESRRPEAVIDGDEDHGAYYCIGPSAPLLTHTHTHIGLTAVSHDQTRGHGLSGLTRVGRLPLTLKWINSL
jgi:hypothetical protein